MRNGHNLNGKAHSEDTIRLFLADDQSIAREGLALLLNQEPDMTVVGEAADGYSALEGVLRSRPDVALVSISLPGLSGMEVTRRISEILPQTPVIIVSMMERLEFLTEALCAGAYGYLLKGAEVEMLFNAIRIVHSGQRFVHPQMVTALVDEYIRLSKAQENGSYAKLSEREKQVLPLLAENRTTQAIADLLGVRPNTVLTFRQRLMKKLDVHSRSELVMYALKQGIIKVDS